MKICRVSQTYPTTTNEGKGLHAYHISNLIKFPTLIITKYYKEKYLKPEDHIELKKIKYIQYPFPSNKKYIFKYILAIITYILGQIEFSIKSIKYIKNFKPDIIHLQSPHAFLIGLYGKYIGAKVVVTFHGSDLRRVSKNKLFMILLKKFDSFYYVSNDMKPILEKYFPNKEVLYTPSGVDTDFFNDVCNLPQREEVLLAVGNIRWQKDYPTMIKAFNLIYAKYPNYKLKIIGSIIEKKELKKINNLIKKYKLEKCIEFLGYKNKCEIREYMSKSKLLLLSSITEGMPKVILESFSCKLPVIATDVGECRLIINNSGVVVEKLNFEELAKNVNNLLADEVLYKKLLNNIKDNSSKFSWRNNAARLNKYYEEILEC